MSRVSKSKIVIPADVKVDIKNDVAHVHGKLGSLDVKVIPGVKYIIENGVISGEGESAAHVGTAMRLLGNAVSGVCKEFESVIEIHNANVRAKQEGKKLKLDIGYSYPVEVNIPDRIHIEIDSTKNRKVTMNIKSISKQLIGDFIDSIRALRKSDPYMNFAVLITVRCGVPQNVPAPKSSKKGK